MGSGSDSGSDSDQEDAVDKNRTRMDNSRSFESDRRWNMPPRVLMFIILVVLNLSLGHPLVGVNDWLKKALSLQWQNKRVENLS